MFRKLVSVYREFVIDGRRAEEVIREMIRLSESLGIMDGRLEKAIMRAFRTENMLDVEIAKEIFHGRLKVIDRSLLGDVDPALIFKSTGCRPHGEGFEAGGPGLPAGKPLP
jgi:hypothetical protein